MDAKSVRERTVKDAKSNLILDCARKLFSDKGFHETRLEDIAQSAGFSKASLYNYFSDKEEIFLSLATRDFEELLTRLRAGMKAEQPLLASLEYAFRTVFTFFGEQFAFLWETANFQTCRQFGMEHFEKHHQEMQQTLNLHYNGLFTTLVERIRDARAKGEILSPVDDETLAQFITAQARGTVFEWKMNRKMGDIEKTVKSLMDFVTRGVGYRGGNQ